MRSKLLQVVGAVALLALIAGSFAALAIVRDRIDVVISPDEGSARRGPEPIELVAGDVASLREDVRTLAEGIGTQVQALHDALEEEAAGREQARGAEIAALRAQVDELRADLARAEERAPRAESLARIESALAAIEARVPVAGAAAAPAEGGGTELAGAAAAPVVEAEGALVGAAAKPADATAGAAGAAAPPPPDASEPSPADAASVRSAPATAGEAPAPKPKKTFLAFELPSSSFAPDRRWRFAVVAGESRVGFDAKSTLHDFSGVTSKVAGTLEVALARPGERPSGAIEVASASLDTGVADRDEEMRARLAVASHPSLRFEWSAYEATESDPRTGASKGTARGRLTIAGTTREVAMPVAVSVDASRRVTIEGELRIEVSDFGIEPPSKLGVISMQDEVVVWVSLRARPVGPAREVAGG